VHVQRHVVQLVPQDLGQAAKVLLLLPTQLGRPSPCPALLPGPIVLILATPAVAAAVRCRAIISRSRRGSGFVSQNHKPLLALLGEEGGRARAPLRNGAAEELARGGPITPLVEAEQVGDAEQLALLIPVALHGVKETDSILLAQRRVLLRPFIDLPPTAKQGDGGQSEPWARARFVPGCSRGRLGGKGVKRGRD
jgi:hypothetical protein